MIKFMHMMFIWRSISSRQFTSSWTLSQIKHLSFLLSWRTFESRLSGRAEDINGSGNAVRALPYYMAHHQTLSQITSTTEGSINCGGWSRLRWIAEDIISSSRWYTTAWNINKKTIFLFSIISVADPGSRKIFFSDLVSLTHLKIQRRFVKSKNI
jgi:hypothetical protein